MEKCPGSAGPTAEGEHILSQLPEDQVPLLNELAAWMMVAGQFALGAICFLRLPTPERELVLKARVIHSTVSRKVPGPAGEPALLFQSGVEFVGLTSDALLALRQLLADLGEAPASL